jgi:hypothetical protein
MRVGGVSLAALSGREHPSSGRQLRRNINDLLAAGQEPVGDVPADALAALDGPDAVGPLLGVLDHRLVAVAVGAEAAGAQDGLVAGHHLGGGGAFVRVHADDHTLRRVHASLRCSIRRLVERGGHRYFELGSPL